MTDIPFGKSDHVRIVYEIALGLSRMGKLDTYLEIGTLRGACFNRVVPLARRAIAVDINLDAQRYLNGGEFHGMSSGEFFAMQRQYLGLGLTFIDGGHTENQSYSDFCRVLHHTRDGGMIILHDVYPHEEKLINKHYCGEVYKTAQHIREQWLDECEICTLPFYFGLAVVRKTDRQLTWRAP